MLFSIIIPIYNAECSLPKTINSIIAQDYDDWELILVDDCSTDTSFEISRCFSKIDTRIKNYRLPVNTGSAKGPCDYGINHSNGDFCLIIGDDDVISRDYLTSMESLVGKADVIIPTTLIKDLDLNVSDYFLPDDKSIDRKRLYSGKDACLFTLPTWRICCNGMAFRKELYNVVTNNNPNNYMNSDEFSTRLLLHEATSVAISNGIYTYFQYSNSITHKKSPKLFEILCVDAQLVDFAMNNYGNELANMVNNQMIAHLISLKKSFYRDYKTYSEQEAKYIKKILKVAYTKVRSRKKSADYRQRIILCTPLFFSIWSRIKA